MELKDYLPLRKLESASRKIREGSIPFYESHFGMKFGEQLRYYLLNFGYLAYRNVELLGINKDQNLESDMVVVTDNVRKHCRDFKPFVVIENQGDGDYYLVDEDDKVWRFLLDHSEITFTGMDLNDYIISRMY